MTDDNRMPDLNELRQEINRLDSELTHVLCRRMECVSRVAAWKKQNGVPVHDAAREEQIVEKVRAMAGVEYADSVERVYRALFAAACDYERKRMEETP